MSTPEELMQEKSVRWKLDDVLTSLKFGRFQLKMLLLTGLLSMYSNLHSLSYVLTTADIDYRCLVPECETANTSNSSYMPAWIREAIPFKNELPSKCKRFKPKSNVTSRDASTCSIVFNPQEEDCDEFVFATDEVTIVNEFGIFCEHRKWQLTLIGTINTLGQFIALPLFGFLSDIYGRKLVVTLCSFISAIFGICRALSGNYLSFAAFEFSDAFFSCTIYNIAFTLGLEFVNPKERPLAATIIAVFYPLGSILMGSLSWYFKNWRMMLLISYSPGLLFILYFWMISESIRWLQIRNRHKEVKSILREISASNKVELPENNFQSSAAESIKHKCEKPDQPSQWKSIKTAFRSRQLIFRILNCSFLWFTNDLTYFGLSVNSIELIGNKYLNFILTGAVEIPAIILAGFVMNKIKRRPSQSSLCILSGVASILCKFVPSVFFMMSKFLITISYCIVHIYTVEMFPTELRLSIGGLVLITGCLGMTLAPQTLLLKSMVNEHAPVILFGVLSIIAGALAVFFPETFDKKLPDTVDDVKLKDECEGTKL